MDDSLAVEEKQPQQQEIQPFYRFKKFLSFREACLFLDMAAKELVELSYHGLIPCYQPTENNLYYKRKEINAWIEADGYVKFHKINIPKERLSYIEKRGR